MVRVSVVVPTHNRSGLLVQTLRSVLWQRDVDLEVLVVDDGSSDDTAEAVAALGDPRVRLLRHATPQGVSAARNRGVAAAAGRWLAFCDDDDLWAPDKLARQLAAAHTTGRAWVYTGELRIDLHGRIIAATAPPSPERVAAWLPHWNLVPGGCSGVMVSRAALAAAGPFDTGLRNLADWDLWIRLGRTGPPARAACLLVAYRLHGGNASQDVAGILDEVDMLDRRDGVAVDRGDFAYYLGVLQLRSGHRRRALGHFADAARRGKVIPAARAITWIGRDRLPWSPFRALPPRHGRQARWRAEAEAWLAELR
jgi:glycosyltransferase involved in cell wall biosynthesis